MKTDIYHISLITYMKMIVHTMVLIFSIWIGYSEPVNPRKVLVNTPYGKILGRRRTEDYAIGKGKINILKLHYHHCLNVIMNMFIFLI